MSIFGYIKDIFNSPQKYAKFWVSFATFVLVLVSQHYADEWWVQPLLTFAGTLGVFIAPNKKV